MYRSEQELLEITQGQAGLPAGITGVALQPNSIGWLIKRAVDILGALLLLGVFSPIFLFVALGVRLSSPGPALYSQGRAGLGGRTFRFYKFRSMVINSKEALTTFLDSDPDAKAQWDKFQKLPEDPRITPLGRFIRKYSLDELPQLWNVLKGDMSLVGPRPCMVEQNALYGPVWADYCSVRPGLTGLWQVSGRNLLTYEQRVGLDAIYVRNWSIAMDMKILLKTVKVVLGGAGSQ